LDGIQLGLDVAGLIPAVGEIADGVNAVIYLGRGDKANAAASAAACIPVAGNFATGGKLVNKGVKAAGKMDEIVDTGRAIKNAAEQVGNAIKNTAKQVGDAIAGNKATSSAKTAIGKATVDSGGKQATETVIKNNKKTNVKVEENVAANAKTNSKNSSETVTKKSNNIESGSKSSLGALGNTGEVRYREGITVNPMEVTYEMRLNPEEYAYAVADKYGINLRGSGQLINIKFDPYHTKGPGVSRELDPTNIILGPQAFMNEEELARTISHELNHARSWLKGGRAPEDRRGLLINHSRLP